MNKYERLMRLTYPIGDCLLAEDFSEEEFEAIYEAYATLQTAIMNLGAEHENGWVQSYDSGYVCEPYEARGYYEEEE